MVLRVGIGRKWKCTGISFIDSTPLRSCHIKREKQHRTFKGMAAKGQCSIGWFFGFKLHLIINDKVEILDFMLTQGNVDDREPLKNNNFHKKIMGKLYCNKGYIGKTSLKNYLWMGCIRLPRSEKTWKIAWCIPTIK